MKITITLPDINLKRFGTLLSMFNISHLLLISLALHLFCMSHPIDGYIFDEAHYVPASLETLKGKGVNPEHPPLTKMLGALSIAVFGNHWFAWRFPIVVCCVLSTYVFYKLAEIFLEKKHALIASTFLSLDIVYFIHGTILVLDMPAILFGLLAIYLYFKGRPYLSMLSGGIGFLFKEMALYFMGAILCYHAVTYIRRIKSFKRVELKKFVGCASLFFLVAVGGIGLYDVVYKPPKGVKVMVQVVNTIVQDQNGTILRTETHTNRITDYILITNPIEHLKYALGYFSDVSMNFTVNPENVRQPWSWILPIGNPFNSPVYLSVVVRVGEIVDRTISWVSQGTLPIWYMLVPIALITLRSRDKFSKLYLGWIVCSFLPWVIHASIQPMTFNYYFIYTVPALCLGIPYFWNNLSISDNRRKIGLVVHLIVTALFFLNYYPVGVFRSV